MLLVSGSSLAPSKLGYFFRHFQQQRPGLASKVAPLRELSRKAESTGFLQFVSNTRFHKWLGTDVDLRVFGLVSWLRKFGGGEQGSFAEDGSGGSNVRKVVRGLERNTIVSGR